MNHSRVSTRGIFRKANFNDFEAINKINSQVHKKHVEKESNFFRNIESRLDEDRFKKEIDKDHVFVVDVDSIVVGYSFHKHIQIKDSQVLKDQKICFIEDFCIDALQKRKGYGNFLFYELEKWSKAQGCTSLELNVWEFNEEAKMFYQKQNMRKAVIVMKKEL